MVDRFQVPNLLAALATRSFPTVTTWNRLEARPRGEDLGRALGAELRDPAWMLGKQWAMGEFRGDDAGSPILAKLHAESSPLTRYRAREGGVHPLSDLPLEPLVECKQVPIGTEQKVLSLDLRVAMGRRWLTLLGTVGDYRAEYVRKYPFTRPDVDDVADADRSAHPEVFALFAALAGRAVDGALLYLYLKADAGHRASDGVTVAPLDVERIDALGPRFLAWFDDLFTQPDDGAWDPSRLEYRFACEASGHGRTKVLTADQHAGGHLDWYSLDVDDDTRFAAADVPSSPPGTSITRTLIPTVITFDGMPNSRWWTFEDHRTNFGDVRPDTTDIAKLLLVEFGLVYANDWFSIPLTLPVGVSTQVRAVVVTNVFGERFIVEPAGRGRDEDWSRFALFSPSTRGSADVPASTELLLLPTTAKVQEGEAREEVWLTRDEMANMVWGIEQRVPLPSGDTKSGTRAAEETTLFHQQRLVRLGVPPRTVPEPASAMRYRLMNTVPENWIPFLPVRVPLSIREIQLQRGSMPRLLDQAGAPAAVKPRTTLLREGLDGDVPAPYFIHEEEVPRAGAQVTQSFHRTRWYGGRVFTWFGAKKKTGRGEADSGLAYDRLVPTKKRETPA